MPTAFTAPKGVAEYLPPRSRAFAAVEQALTGAAGRAGYSPIELAVFEHTEVFTRGVGASTDVVSKEMYTFEDRGGRSLTLRPEGTAGVMRAVIEHGLDRGALPVKVAYAGPFFRAERPQAGRYRQFSQVGIEAIGSADPALDAEVIAVADEGFRALGLTGYRLELTSLGDEVCRPGYRELLQAFLAGLDLDDETRSRAEINPLRVLDDKRPAVAAQLAGAPLMLDHLCDDCRRHFEAVLAVLDALGVASMINPRMVRGLDYYTRTTFEFVHPGLGAQSGMGGGGRYDGLMAELGGQALSGIGYGLGIDRTLLATELEGLGVGGTAGIQVYGVPMGEPASPVLAVLAGRLRAAGIATDRSYGGRGLKAAMRSADASGARLALILGERELAEGSVMLRDLRSGEQHPVDRAEVVAAVQQALRG